MNAPDRLPPHSPQRIVLIEIEKLVRAKSTQLYESLEVTLDKQQIANALFNLKKAERVVVDEGGWYTITARGRECLRGESAKPTPEGAGLRVNDPAAGVPASEKARAGNVTAQIRASATASPAFAHVEKAILELEGLIRHHEEQAAEFRDIVSRLKKTFSGATT